jgi:hypothetical protein
VLKSLLISVAAASAACAAWQVRAEVGDTHLRLQYGRSSETDFVTVIAGDYKASKEGNFMIDGTWSRDYSDTLFGLPIPMTANVGVQWFDERGYQADGYGVTAFIKAHYNWQVPLIDTRVRFGLGEGLSYVNRIPMSEQRDFAMKGVTSRKLMNYMEWTIDVPLSQFSYFDNLMRGHIKESYLGFAVWHRSSVFGLFAETKGGINFMGFGFEAEY